MVITGLTRNQFGGNATWVRIPPSPPTVTKSEHIFFINICMFGIVIYRKKDERLIISRPFFVVLY